MTLQNNPTVHACPIFNINMDTKCVSQLQWEIVHGKGGRDATQWTSLSGTKGQRPSPSFTPKRDEEVRTKSAEAR